MCQKCISYVLGEYFGWLLWKSKINTKGSITVCEVFNFHSAINSNITYIIWICLLKWTLKSKVGLHSLHSINQSKRELHWCQSLPQYVGMWNGGREINYVTNPPPRGMENGDKFMSTTMGSGIESYERAKFREVILYSTVISGKEAGLLFEFLASIYLIKVQILTIFFVFYSRQ